jgi:hypothetical protein
MARPARSVVAARWTPAGDVEFVATVDKPASQVAKGFLVKHGIMSPDIAGAPYPISDFNAVDSMTFDHGWTELDMVEEG